MHYGKGPICPVSADHPSGDRPGAPLSMVFRRPLDLNFRWTWKSELLVDEQAQQALRENEITGYELLETHLRFKSGAQSSRTYATLRTTGWGGVAKPESGIHITEGPCPGCGWQCYSGLQHPECLFDQTQWDGSDIFMIWPLPSHIFVTARFRDIVEEAGLTGLKFIPIDQMKTNDGHMPGSLSLWMPKERARRLGAPFGIW